MPDLGVCPPLRQSTGGGAPQHGTQRSSCKARHRSQPGRRTVEDLMHASIAGNTRSAYADALRQFERSGYGAADRAVELGTERRR